MRNASAPPSPMENPNRDLRPIPRDAEALLRATADITGGKVQEARERAEETLKAARRHLTERQWRGRARQLGRQTDAYVRDHSWTLVGAAIGIGLIAGLLLRRR